jgi:hypothetical protein
MKLEAPVCRLGSTDASVIELAIRDKAPRVMRRAMSITEEPRREVGPDFEYGNLEKTLMLGHLLI